MATFKIIKGQLYKFVDCRIISINGKAVKSDKDKVFGMWIPVDPKA